MAPDISRSEGGERPCPSTRAHTPGGGLQCLCPHPAGVESRSYAPASGWLRGSPLLPLGTLVPGMEEPGGLPSMGSHTLLKERSGQILSQHKRPSPTASPGSPGRAEMQLAGLWGPHPLTPDSEGREDNSRGQRGSLPQTRRGLTLLSQLCRDPAVGKSPDMPGSLEGNTEGPGTASSEPLLPS